jgi:pyridoxal phosphate enzyme (YggS family)
MSIIAENFENLHKQIRRQETLSGREEGAVQLVAVTKTQTAENIEAALAGGHRLFGENKVQEAQAHWAALKQKDTSIRLHLIGPLQTNKVKDAVALFDCIETLDREKLALALADEMKKQGRYVPCLIQVNTGEEDQKAGVSAKYLPEFLDYCRRECALQIDGLMCIPPVSEPAGLHFAFLKELAGRHNLKTLSMGMSGDFERAIAAGATHIRLGTALFGARAA